MKPKMLERGIILTFDELRILLQALGAEEIEGVYMPEKTFTEEEVLQAMQHLVHYRILQVKGDGFYIREDIKEILAVIVSPEKTFLFDREDENPQYFCYLAGEQIVVSEQYWRKKETVQLRWFSPVEFNRWKETVESGNREERGIDQGDYRGSGSANDGQAV